MVSEVNSTVFFGGMKPDQGDSLEGIIWLGNGRTTGSEDKMQTESKKGEQCKMIIV